MTYAAVAGILLFALGYYVGREIGRTHPVREQLLELREKKSRATAA